MYVPCSFNEGVTIGRFTSLIKLWLYKTLEYPEINFSFFHKGKSPRNTKNGKWFCLIWGNYEPSYNANSVLIPSPVLAVVFDTLSLSSSTPEPRHGSSSYLDCGILFCSWSLLTCSQLVPSSVFPLSSFSSVCQSRPWPETWLESFSGLQSKTTVWNLKQHKFDLKFQKHLNRQLN